MRIGSAALAHVPAAGRGARGHSNNINTNNNHHDSTNHNTNNTHHHTTENNDSSNTS